MTCFASTTRLASLCAAMLWARPHAAAGAQAPAAGTQALAAPRMAAQPSCQGTDVFGLAWLVDREADGTPLPRVWTWPRGEDPHRMHWQAVAPETCTSMPPDGGAVLQVPALRRALGDSTGGAYLRQLMFRLGLDKVGEVRAALQHPDAATYCTQGAIAWPGPYRGPMSAFGPAQPVGRPKSVPEAALGFVSASISPGRAWQELEAFVGGIYPLEATLVGTQIAGWEQGPDNGALAADIMGYKAQLWTAYQLPSPDAARVVFILPVAKPKAALRFVTWAIDVVSAFAPSVHGRTQCVDKQRMLAVDGLVSGGKARATLYFLATPSALVVATRPTDAEMAAKREASAQGSRTSTASAPQQLCAATPATAVAFGQVQHMLLPRRFCASFTSDRADPKTTATCLGRTTGWFDTDQDGWRWQMRSVLRE